MKRLIFSGFGAALFSLALFAVWGEIALPPTFFLQGSAGAVLGMLLLWADSLLPVPSSVIMLALGRFYGIFLGASLSLAGGLGSGLICYLLGRAGVRLVSQSEEPRLKAWIERWGMLAVTVTRPIPILAETVGFMAGLAGMRGSRVMIGSLLGCFPTAVFYAWAGSAGGSLGVAAFLGVTSAALALGWVLVRFAQKDTLKDTLRDAQKRKET